VRLWLSDAERRPDPEPARADARKALLVGTVAWILGLGATLIFRTQLVEAGLDWLVWACVTGAGLGLVGLVVVQGIRWRIARQDERSSV
jgi:hypothetical protein